MSDPGHIDGSTYSTQLVFYCIYILRYVRLFAALRIVLIRLVVVSQQTVRESTFLGRQTVFTAGESIPLVRKL